VGKADLSEGAPFKGWVVKPQKDDMSSNTSVSRGTLLKFEDVTLNFGKVTALNHVSFKIREGEILAIIGPNGAGKTCTLNCISGLYRPEHGAIHFNGEEITKFPPHKVSKKGIARTFQNIALYSGMTVVDNIMSGRHIVSKAGPLACAFYFGRALREEVRERREVEYLIDFLELGRWRKEKVGSLPYGLQKRVDLGRALAMEPMLLLLDEPMAGMNVEEKGDIVRFILDIHRGQGPVYSESKVLREGVKSIVMIEHDMGIIMDIADRVIVLDFGSKIAEGAPGDIKRNKSVRDAYLGAGM
jgi:branched-chain amino acid transport system ATP-binding protein